MNWTLRTIRAGFNVGHCCCVVRRGVSLVSSPSRRLASRTNGDSSFQAVADSKSHHLNRRNKWSITHIEVCRLVNSENVCGASTGSQAFVLQDKQDARMVSSILVSIHS